jgi:quinol-cytochrome oxidoreductase complex cytochrome b subunit
MTPLTILVTGIAVALAASTLTVIAIREPLHRQLDALCATGASATYWTRTAVTVLYLLPLFVVLVFGLPDLTRVDVTAAEVARRTIAAAAFALASIVSVMGLRIAGQRPPMRPPSPTIDRYGP